MTRFGDGRDWFFERPFGLFLHWGLYAVEAWHEQLQWRGGVPRDEYAKLIDRFNPKGFDPNHWIDVAEEAGMEYIVLTSKHHDGFCLWDTAETEFNVVNTPYGKDILAQVADACHERKMPLCFYYSPIDWHVTFYPAAGRSHELDDAPLPDDTPDFDRFMDFTRAQVRELCTKYGEIHGIWWDGGAIFEHDDPSLNAMIRELQPNCIINNRGFGEGDFGTPERDKDECRTAGPAFEQPTQACQALGKESWGYREGEDYYSLRYLQKCIDIVMAKGGGYLLNAGPRADGTIAPNEQAALRELGIWYRAVREAFIDVEYAVEELSTIDMLVTRREDLLYLHLFDPPEVNRVVLDHLSTVPARATLLNNGQSLEIASDSLPTYFRRESRCPVRIKNLPVDEMSGTVMVIKLELDS
ncbi:MAG: alpha-L-fucosidase [Candidatus Latescibacteria bacterium]|nr:alpha-L-fucosidase [Candidatus Latescibacterota bacterium]